MYALDETDQEYWVYRLMIDAAFQRRGYGRSALSLVIERIAKLGRKVLYISFEPENRGAELLYNLGCVPDGRRDGSEVIPPEFAAKRGLKQRKFPDPPFLSFSADKNKACVFGQKNEHITIGRIRIRCARFNMLQVSAALPDPLRFTTGFVKRVFIKYCRATIRKV